MSNIRNESEIDIRASASSLLAWCAAGVLNAVVLAAAPLPPGGVGVRVAHLFFDAANMVAIGCVAWLLGRAWERWAPKVRGIQFAGLSILAISVGFGVLPVNLQNFAARFGDPFWLWHNALIVLVSLGIPLVWTAGRWLRRPRYRWAACAIAAMLVVANHHVLQRDYQGAHVFLVWAATSLAASTTVGAKWPDSLRRGLQKKGGLPRVILLASLSLLGAASVLVWPRPAVLSELLATDSAILIPNLAQARVALSRSSAQETPPGFVDPAWLSDRSQAPDVPPSQPRLTPDDTLIVFMSADAFRADVLEDPRYARTLPNISALARRSVDFKLVRSAGSDTRNSLGSMFTSKYYLQLDLKLTRKHGMILTRDKTPRFNVLLHEKMGFFGINIAAYSPLVNSNGFVTGFDDETVVKPSKGQPWALAREMTDVALQRMAEHTAGPMFLFMHWMDAHDPYDAGGVEGSEFERYVGELRLYDQQVGRIWKWLEDKDLLRRSIVIFSSDHGESLGEHNIPHHGTSICESLVRVPLMIRVPGVPPREVNQPVTQLDIAPTLLDLMGIASPGQYMGQSLVPFMRGETPRLRRPIAADQRIVRSLYADNYKVMHYRKVGAVEVYDLAKDPHEKNNLYGQLGGKDDELFSAVRGFFAAHQLNDSWEYPR